MALRNGRQRRELVESAIIDMPHEGYTDYPAKDTACLSSATLGGTR